MSLLQATALFATEEKAEAWLAAQRWPEGIVSCPKCKSSNVRTRPGSKPKPTRYRCRPCQKDFSVRTGTTMHASNLKYQTWGWALYQVLTNIKGVSSMKLHRDLGITQKSAWHLGHRLRRSFQLPEQKFTGEVEVDETYIGGLEKNKHSHKRLDVGGGTTGKAAVVGMKSRTTGMVFAQVTPFTDKSALQGFVRNTSMPGSRVYTDDANVYRGLPNHAAVKHSVGEYVRGLAHTNGIESFWSMFKRGYHGTYHKMSYKHLHRYVDEFAARNNMRPADTLDQMGATVLSMEGRSLTYEELTS